jgi:hypothetical protein
MYWALWSSRDGDLGAVEGLGGQDKLLSVSTPVAVSVQPGTPRYRTEERAHRKSSTAMACGQEAGAGMSFGEATEGSGTRRHDEGTRSALGEGRGRKAAMRSRTVKCCVHDCRLQRERGGAGGAGGLRWQRRLQWVWLYVSRHDDDADDGTCSRSLLHTPSASYHGHSSRAPKPRSRHSRCCMFC